MVAEGHSEVNPFGRLECRDCTASMHVPHEPVLLTLDQRDELIERALRIRHELGVTVSLALFQGLRRGEILGLRWEDIAEGAIMVRRSLNLNTGTIGRPKKGVIRTVPLHRRIKSLLADIERESEWVISKESYRRGQGLRVGFDRLRRELRLGNITFHDLRHNFVYHCLTQGIDPLAVSVLVGHGSGKGNIAFTLRRYGNLTGADFMNALDQLK